MTEKSNLPQLPDKVDIHEIAGLIKQFGHSLGFQQVGITDTRLDTATQSYKAWIDKHYHGEMEYMARNIDKRCQPELLVPKTLTIISVRMDYFPNAHVAEEVLSSPSLGYISRYALGRDYHKVMRKRLQKLADYIRELVGDFGYRVFVDSAPVLEKNIAERAGLGWVGKHTNLINRNDGSWFFLGELFTSLPLPVDEADIESNNHCGKCTACIDICPTRAIVAPYEVDARRCISYLTIELRNSIPVEFRKAMGNRIYGCDDCQMVCPWNRFAKLTDEQDYQPRYQLDNSTLISLFAWDETTFLSRMEGSPIRRIGHECWLRNIAVALGNTEKSQEVIEALKRQLDHPSEMVREHVQWALNEHV